MFARRTRTVLSEVNPLRCKSKVQQDHLNQEQRVCESRVRRYEMGNNDSRQNYLIDNDFPVQVIKSSRESKQPDKLVYSQLEGSDVKLHVDR